MNYWQQQSADPIYPDILWSKPENKRGAGKLLIIGGQAQEFAGVAAAYMAAEKAGAGTIRVIMPSSTEKVTRMLPNIEYAPSNPSGSFSKTALASFLDASAWADHVLLPGDLGKNSETTTILDGYLLKCPTNVSIAQDALQTITIPFPQLLQRPTILTLDIGGLQKLGTAMDIEKPITSNMGAAQLAEALHILTKSVRGTIICTREGITWVAAAGQVCSSANDGRALIDVASTAAVWAMQQTFKHFEAIVTSLVA